MQSLDEPTNDEENKQALEGDFQRPFTPPDGVVDRIPKDHPKLDGNIDLHEWYDEGREASTK